MIRRSTVSPRRLPLALLAAAVALQLAAPGFAFGTEARTELRLATSAPLPAASTAVDVRGVERLDGNAGDLPTTTLPGPARILPAAKGAVADGFCPWRAAQALARAGRSASPPTAPPISGI
ncbi:MAG: hypothetical protein PVF05_01150 [Gemmatimonadales bacterium]|jgi:hypothetical protein